jgi:hypothetical protein
MSIAKLKSKHEHKKYRGQTWTDRRGWYWRYLPEHQGWFFAPVLQGPWLVFGRHPYRSRQYGPFELVQPGDTEMRSTTRAFLAEYVPEYLAEL